MFIFFQLFNYYTVFYLSRKIVFFLIETFLFSVRNIYRRFKKGKGREMGKVKLFKIKETLELTQNKCSKSLIIVPFYFLNIQSERGSTQWSLKELFYLH